MKTLPLFIDGALIAFAPAHAPNVLIALSNKI
jgi:hypothetical protein